MVRWTPLDAMNVFVTVADLRGFAPAARLHLSPSAVTRLVAALEESTWARACCSEPRAR